jgi:hypothetical protein
VISHLDLFLKEADFFCSFLQVKNKSCLFTSLRKQYYQHKYWKGVISKINSKLSGKSERCARRHRAQRKVPLRDVWLSQDNYSRSLHAHLISDSATAMSHSKWNCNHVRPYSAVNTHRYVVCGERGGTETCIG